MSNIQSYKNIQSLAVISYSSYDEYGKKLVETLKQDFEDICIFPFQTKQLKYVSIKDEKYVVDIDELETYYGSLSKLSRIYAFENFLKEQLSNNLRTGLVCSTELIVVKSIMNTLFAQPTIKYTFQSLKLFPLLYAVYFKSTKD